MSRVQSRTGFRSWNGPSSGDVLVCANGRGSGLGKCLKNCFTNILKCLINICFGLRTITILMKRKFNKHFWVFNKHFYLFNKQSPRGPCIPLIYHPIFWPLELFREKCKAWPSHPRCKLVGYDNLTASTPNQAKTSHLTCLRQAFFQTLRVGVGVSSFIGEKSRFHSYTANRWWFKRDANKPQLGVRSWVHLGLGSWFHIWA